MPGTILGITFAHSNPYDGNKHAVPGVVGPNQGKVALCTSGDPSHSLLWPNRILWDPCTLGSSIYCYGLFHEAGHVLFLPLGRFMTILGGTLNQWLIPLIVIFAFLLKTRDTFGACVGLWWLGQSFMDAAPYINDARAGRLILLGGGTGRDQPGYHDWENILGDLEWLDYDHMLAGIVDGMGIAFILLSFLWGALVLSFQYKNLASPDRSAKTRPKP